MTAGRINPELAVSPPRVALFRRPVGLEPTTSLEARRYVVSLEGRRVDRTSACRSRATSLSINGRYKGPRPEDALVVAKGNGGATLNEETPMPQHRSVAPFSRQCVPLPGVIFTGIHGVFR